MSWRSRESNGQRPISAAGGDTVPGVMDAYRWRGQSLQLSCGSRGRSGTRCVAATSSGHGSRIEGEGLRHSPWPLQEPCSDVCPNVNEDPSLHAQIASRAGRITRCSPAPLCLARSSLAVASSSGGVHGPPPRQRYTTPVMLRELEASPGADQWLILDGHATSGMIMPILGSTTRVRRSTRTRSTEKEPRRSAFTQNSAARAAGALRPPGAEFLRVGTRSATPGTGSGRAQRELAQAGKSGLIVARRIGHQKPYQANAASPLLLGVAEHRLENSRPRRAAAGRPETGFRRHSRGVRLRLGCEGRRSGGERHRLDGRERQPPRTARSSAHRAHLSHTLGRKVNPDGL